MDQQIYLSGLRVSCSQLHGLEFSPALLHPPDDVGGFWWLRSDYESLQNSCERKIPLWNLRRRHAHHIKGSCPMNKLLKSTKGADAAFVLFYLPLSFVDPI